MDAAGCAVIQVEWLKAAVVVTVNQKELDALTDANPGLIQVLPSGPKRGFAVVATFEGETFFLMGVNKTRTTILHECIHMAQFLLDDRNAPTDVSNSETVAYMAEWLYKETCEIAKVKP
jgi:hypothetical protein